MKNLVIVTSIINTPDTPLSYISSRSVFTRKERFEQTKKTIESIKEKINDCEILFVDCTDFNEYENNYLSENCEHILNLWNNKELHQNIFGLSKALGEGSQTIMALRYIISNNLIFDNLFKVSGRYFLNDNFNFERFENDKLVFIPINGSILNINTSIYKIPHRYIKDLHDYLVANISKMVDCIGYEILMALFLKDVNKEEIIFYDKLGIEGRVSVSNDYYSS
jgi:hypothetical protein